MSQTIEENLTDSDLTVLFEDLDFDLTCESYYVECPRIAVWRYESACATVLLLCQKCHESVQETSKYQIGCKLCDTHWGHVGIEFHWTWELI